MTHKNSLQAQIIVYLRRREIYKEKHPDWRTNPKCQKVIKNFARKLNIWRTTLRRIEKRQAIVHQLATHVCDFVGIESLQNSLNHNRYNHKVKNVVLARFIFYKYVIESHIYGCFAAEYVGAKDRGTPSRGRLSFTRSFKTNMYNREMWHRFKLYVADLKEDRKAA